MLRWPRHRLDAWLEQSLQEAIDHAWTSAPLYRRCWQEAGVSPGSFSALSDLARFPLVDKRELTAARSDWTRFSRGAAGLSTKGTSGAPLVMWLDRDDYEATLPGVIMGFEASGMRRGMRVMLLHPAWHRMSCLEAAASRFIGATPVYAAGSVLDAAHAPAWLDTLERHRPRYVVAFTPLLLSLLHDLDARAADPRRWFGHVETLMTLGMPITPELRAWLKGRLGVGSLWDRGGSTEGLAMDECDEHDHQHVYEDTVYCEVLDDDGQPVAPGARGRLVFTKLNRSPSPIIRYDSGDVAAFHAVPCPCGNGFRRLMLYGRQESAVSVSGKTVLAWDVRRAVEADPDLVGHNFVVVRDSDRWRGVQSGRDGACLRVVLEGHGGDGHALRQRLRDALGIENVDVTWAGDVALQWSLRQVYDAAELPFLSRV